MRLSKTAGKFRTVLIALALPAAGWANGAVYAMTNALGKNQIKVWTRGTDGKLTFAQTISTLEGGSGMQLDPTDSLGSQGALALDSRHRFLFAVNTNSKSTSAVGGNGVHDCREGSISSFLVGKTGTLTLVGNIASGGLFPDSLTISGNTLFVLNSGGPGISPVCGNAPNITGFTVGKDGRLTAIAHSTRFIFPGISPGSALNCDPGGFPTPQFQCGQNPPAFPRSPGQVGFTPDGDALVVTVKATNSIYVFPFEQMNKNVRLGSPVVWYATGPNQPTYFGFSFDLYGNMIVAEPFGATPTIPASPQSAVSSFAIQKKVFLIQPLSASVPNGRGTACWIALDALTRKFVFVTNNATSDISSYSVDGDGNLKILAAVAASADGPNDMATVSEVGSNFLYALNSGNGTVGAWAINENGSLTSIGLFAGLPAAAGAQGLAAY